MASRVDVSGHPGGNPAPTLLNPGRPPVFCPGCSHENVLRSLDQAFQGMGLRGNEIAMVSDIGCSGLFDTFFHTHAFHGLHGRVLTYAAGLKLARPGLTVVATMGDGGVGIGGAHLLAASRRNLDLTLLVLNNYNFGMTGGQCSFTTPSEASVGSSFLNRIERPLDVCQVVAAAGAPFVARCSTYQKDLPRVLERAIRYSGFSVVEIHGICPGRYTRKNRLTPKTIQEDLAALPSYAGEVVANARPEYGEAYRAEAAKARATRAPISVTARFAPPAGGRQDVLILGSAGQRVITSGEVLGLAALSAGLNVTQKNEYDITVLRGPSIAELTLSLEPIGYTGIERPTCVLALAAEGVDRRREVLTSLEEDALVLRAAGVEIPPTVAEVVTLDFKGLGVRTEDFSLAGLAALAGLGRVIRPEMLRAALEARFSGSVLETAVGLVDRVQASMTGQR